MRQPRPDAIEVLLTLSPAQYDQMGGDLQRVRRQLDLPPGTSNTDIIIQAVGRQARVASEIRVDDEHQPPFYTAKSLARRLSVTERTVRRLMQLGEIPSYYIGAARRIDPKDVDQYLAGRRDEGTGK